MDNNKNKLNNQELKQNKNCQSSTTGLLKPKLIIVLAITGLALFGFPEASQALDVEAESCSKEHVQAAATQVQNAGGGIVTIPEGDCTWTSSVSVSGPVSFIGAGSDKTILRKDGAAMFNHSDGGSWIRYSKIGFYGLSPDHGNSAISIKTVDNFRIDHSHFYPSRWNAATLTKRAKKGLIDHNVFERVDFGTSDYGIEWGSLSPTNKPTCMNYSDQACYNQWDAWWDNPDVDTGNGFANFNPNYPAGTADAIFVEDNTFNWRGSAVESNWGSMASVVVRYNTITNTDGNNGGFKPGAQWVEMYNNTITNISPDAPSGAAVYFRSSGLFYNNTIKNYGSGGAFVAYYCAYGYCYTEQILQKDTFIWGNTYINTNCPYDSSACWYEFGEGAPERITENVNYFFRAPQAGDRIYNPASDPNIGYTPYPYPHPLTLGDGGDITPPDAPQGLTVE